MEFLCLLGMVEEFDLVSEWVVQLVLENWLVVVLS